MSQTLRVDTELENLIPPLTDKEYDLLEKSILAEGCRDAIVLWGNIIVDGHNRFKICCKNGIPFNTVQREFKDKNEVKLWMMHNQLARRNLNDAQRIDIVRQCEDAVKEKARERQATSTGGLEPQLRENFLKAEHSRATDELGALAGVSHKTYEHATAVYDEAPASVAQAMKDGKLSINKAYEVTQLEPEQQAEIAERIEHIEDEPEETNTPLKIVNDVAKPFVVNNSGNNEWYTPKEYVELVKNVLGEIELDPASCEMANETVQAAQYYSKQDDGLQHDWAGKVYMNPPYSKELIGKFTQKFTDEFSAGNITEGIVLVNNATDTAWFNNLAEYAAAICFVSGRIKFNSPTKDTSAPLQGQAFLYFGDNEDVFIDEFISVGIGCKVVHLF